MSAIEKCTESKHTDHLTTSSDDQVDSPGEDVFDESHVNLCILDHLCNINAEESTADDGGCCRFRSRRNSLWRKLWKLQKLFTNSKAKHSKLIKNGECTDGVEYHGVYKPKSLCSKCVSSLDRNHCRNTVTSMACAICKQTCCSNAKSMDMQHLSSSHCHCAAAIYDDLSELSPKKYSSILQQLFTEAQLETLLIAMETEGGVKTNCVLLENDCLKHIADLNQLPPSFLMCKLWRWPDVNVCDHHLKQLTYCNWDKLLANHEICCNPHHWSRLHLPGDVMDHEDCHTHHVYRTTPHVTSHYSPPPLPLPLTNPYTGSCDETETAGGDSSSTRSLSQVPQHCYRTSTTTTGLYGGSGPSSRWCELAYWQQDLRVGPRYPVYDTTVDVFGEVGCGADGLCVTALSSSQHSHHASQHSTHASQHSHHASQHSSQHSPHASQHSPHASQHSTHASQHSPHASQHSPQHSGIGSSSIQRTQDKIGYGLALSLERDSVWVYNRGTSPLFVSSPTLLPAPRPPCDHPAPPHRHTTHKVAPGYSLLAFDVTRWPCCGAGEGGECGAPVTHPHPPTVTISFCKGWGGPNYRRQNVTQCPCWLEVLILRCGPPAASHRTTSLLPHRVTPHLASPHLTSSS